jgi:hypothetical protein
MRRLALTLLAFTACTTPVDGDAEVTLGQRSWSVGAIFTDSGAQVIWIRLAQQADAETCGWLWPDSVEIELPVDAREPHVLPWFEIGSAQYGKVYFKNDSGREVQAVSGRVHPTTTSWARVPESGQFAAIAAIDGTFDVVLDDGRALSGNFSALPCGGRR